MRHQDPIVVELGVGLPPNEVHAVTTSMPKWEHSIGWATQNPEILAKIPLGYPRFFIHPLINELAALLLSRALATEADGGEAGVRRRRALLFPHVDSALACVEYLRDQNEPDSTTDPFLVWEADLSGGLTPSKPGPAREQSAPFHSLWMVVYPEDLSGAARLFWQHTGFGLSSRHAEYWLQEQHRACLENGGGGDGKPSDLPLAAAKEAAHTIRLRISGLLSFPTNQVGPDDVYLYPCGMSAITHSATALMALHGVKASEFRVAAFGFLYLDTFKVLERVERTNCKLYGYASGADLDQLEKDLEGGMHLHAVYTEFPGNPLIRSIDLGRLRSLALRHGFHVVLDDTVGTSVNLELSPSCDLICTSLTKMFSGACDVMGGSVTVCGGARNRDGLRRALADQHGADVCFPTDVVRMEANSRDFVSRVLAANGNAAALAARLRGHGVVREVMYPEGGPRQHLFDRFKRAAVVDEDGRRRETGYGYMLSMQFVEPTAAVAFHDALALAKGPSLGTNFSLCCAYTILAHATELEWAAEYGMPEHLVRLSVGIEDRACLEARVDAALAAAADAVARRVPALCL